MIYFDNAASGFFKPSSSVSALLYAAKDLGVNGSRSSHKLAIEAQQKVYDTRKLLSEIFDNKAIERVIFTLNCSEALNFAIFGAKLRYGEIVTTVTEHNSVLRPLYHLKEGGVKIKYAKPSKMPFVTEKDVLSLVSKKTDFVVMNAVSNVTGYKNEFEQTALSLKKLGIPIIVDGAQASGHIKIDMEASGIDCLCLAGHKGLYAVQGVGALIFGKNFEISPTLFGGSGTESFLKVPTCYPEMLEVGTQNLPAIMSLKEGAFYAYENLENNAALLMEMTAYLLQKLADMSFVEVYSAPNPFGIVSFSHTNHDSIALAGLLDERFEIAVRGGFHCAPLMHKFLGTDISGLVRVSLSPFNTISEIDTFVHALNRIF